MKKFKITDNAMMVAEDEREMLVSKKEFFESIDFQIQCIVENEELTEEQERILRGKITKELVENDHIIDLNGFDYEICEVGFYETQLILARQNKIDIVSLSVAYEVECTFDINLSKEEFEMCCNLVEETYMKSENLTIWSIAIALCNLIHEKVLENKEYENIKDLIKNSGIDRYTLMQKASYYC
jgi:hypothetical protein